MCNYALDLIEACKPFRVHECASAIDRGMGKMASSKDTDHVPPVHPVFVRILLGLKCSYLTTALTCIFWVNRSGKC